MYHGVILCHIVSYYGIDIPSLPSNTIHPQTKKPWFSIVLNFLIMGYLDGVQYTLTLMLGTIGGMGLFVALCDKSYSYCPFMPFTSYKYKHNHIYRMYCRIDNQLQP